MLGLQYHPATLLALILIATFSVHIFTNAILKSMKTMKKINFFEGLDARSTRRNSRGHAGGALSAPSLWPRPRVATLRSAPLGGSCRSAGF